MTSDRKTISAMQHNQSTAMMRHSLSLRVFMVIVIATVLVTPNVCSADNLRSMNRTNRRNSGGLGSNLPKASATSASGESEQKEPFHDYPVFRINQEEKEFFNELMQQVSSFDDTPAPSKSVTTTPPVTIPSASPTDRATPNPTSNPTKQPTRQPTSSPTRAPTKGPTARPTASPTITKSNNPTGEPSKAPSAAPSPSPTESPSVKPSAEPTVVASGVPSETPTKEPTASPTTKPPTGAPTVSPVSPTPSPLNPPTPSPLNPPTPSPLNPPTPSPMLPPTPSPLAGSTSPPTEGPSQRCNLTEDGRVALINIFLRVVSNPADVDTPGSPQALALDWIIFEDPMQVCPQDKNLIQRYVMAVFYFSTRGDRWTECSAPPPVMDVVGVEVANTRCSLRVAGFDSDSNAWLTGGTECQWGGLGCNEENFVTRIEMEQNGVAGTLPHELSRLQTLSNMILEEGILTGTIPSELGEIRSLEQIDLNFNLLQGSIPEELYGLSNLRQMDLNDNELTGTISSSISGLVKMSFFQIENNIFTGTVPDTFGALTGMEVATMDNNQLSGTMPCSSMNTTGTLKVLTSDCLGAPNRPSPPLIICDCCTQCF